MPLSRLRPNQTKIFISYRRAERAAQPGRLFEHLSKHFGSRVVFTDTESIAPGRDFRKEIEEALNTCEILLAIIGPDWLTYVDKKGRRRLNDPKDFVRLEIATALKRNIRVIPVLVGGASMPTKNDKLPQNIASLIKRQGWTVSDAQWAADVKSLIEKISGDIKRPNYPVILLTTLILLGVLTLSLWAAGFFSDPPHVIVPPTSTPTVSPTASPIGGSETQPQASVTPSSTPRPSSTPKSPPRSPTPKKQMPKGNSNQREYIDKNE